MLHRVVLTALTLMLIASCNAGGSRSALQQEATFQPPQELLAAMPAFPAGDEVVHPLRATASVDAAQDGADFDSASTAVTVSQNGALIPAVEGKFEWAIYRFSGIPDELISAVSCNVSGLDNGEQVYLAVADYDNARWDFLSPQTTTQQSFPLSPERGRWQSASANSYIAVLAHDNTTFVVESVSLRYEERFNVLGTVLDGRGDPVEGVLMTSFFGAVSDISDANGQFALPGLPNGNWPVAASLNGWTFYNQPAFVELDGADGSLSLIGNPGGSRYENKEAVPGNDLPAGAEFDFADGPLLDSVSALEDPSDYYRCTITEAGSYYFYFHEALGTALFPELRVRTPEINPSQLASSAAVISGSFAAGFSVFDVPQEVIVEVTCAGGGADYELSLLEGPLHAVGGTITASLEQFSNFIVEMELTAVGHETEYFAGANGQELTYLDLHRRPGNTLVVPEAFGASFTPQEQEFNLGQLRLDVNFTATSDTFADDFEPNNSFAEAHVFASVPVELEEPVSIGSVDFVDWYTLTPPAGSHLSVHVFPEAESERSAGMEVLIYDSQEVAVAEALFGEDGFYFIPSFLTDGQPYYIEVRRLAGGQLSSAYTMEVDHFVPTTFSMQLTVGGTELVPGALFIVHSEEFEESYSLVTGPDGETDPLYLEPGSIVNIECRRFGLSVDGVTRRFEVGGESQIVGFNAEDWGIDSNEPNEDEPITRLFTPPIQIEGSASAISDRKEHFRIPFPINGAILVEASIDSPNGILDVEGASGETGELADKDLSDGDSMLIPVRNEDFIDLDLTADAGEFTYSLQLTFVEGYIISGTAKALGGAALAGANVMLSPGGQIDSVNFAGEYEFDIMPPGDYSVSLLAVGGDPGYSAVDVSLVDQDVVLDFSGIDEFYADDFEPNNQQFESHSIEVGELYLATVGDVFVPDDSDWYFLDDLEAGDRLQISVNAEAQSRMIGAIYPDDLPFFELADLYYVFPGLLRKDFVVPADGDYYLNLQGYGSYLLSVEALP